MTARARQQQCSQGEHIPLAQDAPYSDITYKIIGAALAVHHKIGPGYKEQVYQDMLTDQMLALGLTVEPEKKVEIVVDDWQQRIAPYLWRPPV